jgi:hypothetical protein
MVGLPPRRCRARFCNDLANSKLIIPTSLAGPYGRGFYTWLCTKSAQRGFCSLTPHKIRTGPNRGAPQPAWGDGSDQPITQLTVPELERLFGPHFHELTLRLVAIAPSSDFVSPENSIPQAWIRLFVESHYMSALRVCPVVKKILHGCLCGSREEGLRYSMFSCYC